MTVSATRPALRSKAMLRAAIGVLCATLASLSVLPVFILLAAIDVPADEGDSWIRGAIGLILIAPVLAVSLAGYYAIAALVTSVLGRWRLAGLVALAVGASGAFAIWAAPSAGRHDVLRVATLLLLADLLLGTAVLYFIYVRRKPGSPLGRAEAGLAQR